MLGIGVQLYAFQRESQLGAGHLENRQEIAVQGVQEKLRSSLMWTSRHLFAAIVVFAVCSSGFSDDDIPAGSEPRQAKIIDLKDARAKRVRFQDPNELFVADLNRMSGGITTLREFATAPKLPEGLTQNFVIMYVDSLQMIPETLEAMKYFKDYSPTVAKKYDEVMTEAHDLSEVVRSTGILERLEKNGFRTKILPGDVVKKPLPSDLLEEIRLHGFSNQFANIIGDFTGRRDITPTISRIQDRLGLPGEDVRRYIATQSKLLGFQLDTLNRLRRLVLDDQYDLEPVDRLMKETDRILSGHAVDEAIYLMKRSRTASDREAVAAFEDEIKQVKVTLAFLQARGRLGVGAMPTAEKTPTRGNDRDDFYDDLLNGSPKTQDSRYARALDSTGQPRSDFFELLLSDGAYNQGLSSDEIYGVVSNLMARCQAPCRKSSAEYIDEALATLRSDGAPSRMSMVATQKAAAVLHRIGDEKSYQALEVLALQSRSDAARISTVRDYDEYRSYFTDLVADLKKKHPEYRTGLTRAKRVSICVKGFMNRLAPDLNL
jgi:hypothetical protein